MSESQESQPLLDNSTPEGTEPTPSTQNENPESISHENDSSQPQIDRNSPNTPDHETTSSEAQEIPEGSDQHSSTINIPSSPQTTQPAPPPEEPTQQRPNDPRLPPPNLYWINRHVSEDSSDSELRPDSEAWANKELHLFIVTDAGKPVYSRYGTLQMLSPILCTCVAILGHMESLQEELNHFRAGSHTFVFLPKKPFVFIAVSKSSLPVSYLFKQLNFLYYLFLSLFSENLIGQLSIRPSCDFRQIAEGTRPAWDGVVNNVSEDPAFIFAPAIPVSQIDPRLRTQLAAEFNDLPACKLSMLMHRNRVIAIDTCNCDTLSLRLIVELMWTPVFQNGESWTPFFARDSTHAMYHIYIYKHKSSDFCLVMLCSDSQKLIEYHGRAVHIFKSLENCLPQLQEPFTWEPTVFYCWALHSIEKGQVYVTDPLESFFCDGDGTPQDKMQELCRQLAKSCDMVETNKVDGEYMFRGEKEVIVVYKNKDMELYAVAKSSELPDSEISSKLEQLKSFITRNWDKMILENKFQITSFT